MSRIVGILLFTLALSAGAQEYLVSGAAVRLRDKPDPTSKALATVPFGTRVSILTTKAPDPRWVAFWFQGLQGWIAKEYLWPYQPSQRGISYLDLATKQFDASQDSFGNLVELLSFIDSIQFDIPDSRSSKAMEALRVSVLLRSIELATRTGNKEWLSRYTQGRDYPSDRTHGVQSPSSPNQTNITTGPNSPIVSNVAGNVNIIYGDRDKHRLRITYWRLKGIAADFLVRGLLSPEWESILGGQQEILNNDVLKYARDISARFSLPAHGDLFVGDGRIVQGDLERLTKLHGDKTAGRNLRLALGGQQGYSMIFPDRDAAFTIAKTDRWPNAYSLFHVCDSSGEARPHLWKFVTRSDLESYSQRIGEYIQYITRSDSNISYFQGVQHGPTERKVIDALSYITQEQMPSDFLLVLGGLAAHGGWELNFQPREIEIEIAAVENSSTRTISIGDLGFAATDFRTLTSYDDATKKLGLGSKSIMKPLTSGLLRPGEKIVIPLRLAFVLKFDVQKCNSPQYRGDPIELQSGYSGMEKFHKSRQSMQMNSLPSATPRYTLGPAWQIRSLAVDGLTIPIRQANFNGVNIYLGNEKGSCPFVYTRSDDTGLWLGEGHVLLGATSRLLERRETKLLKNTPRELRIIQQEDELAYIREIYVEERFGDGRIVVHRPDSEAGEFLVTRSKERILRFSNLSANDRAAYALTITGYYIPFGSLNFESKFITAADERAGSSR